MAVSPQLNSIVRLLRLKTSNGKFNEMRYVLDFDEQDYLIESSKDLARHLEVARQREYADLWLTQKLDVTPTRFEKFVYGLFGLGVPNEGKSLGCVDTNKLNCSII